jgi:ketosteroid isomerase-like protein
MRSTTAGRAHLPLVIVLTVAAGIAAAAAPATPTPAAPAPATPATPDAARVAASPDSAELRAFKRAIRARYDLKEKAFAAHDAETIVTRFYAPDVISVGEGEGIYIGRDQIRPLYEAVVKDNRVKVDSVYTYVNGSAGWDWADFHVFPADPKNKPFTFAILFLWAKVDGAWICKGDFFVNGSFRSGKLTPAVPSK